MKNKKMIILAASLVMSLTISGAVTNLVKGREGENNKALWVQVAEDTLETMGKADVASVSDPAMMPEEEVKTTDTSVEAPKSVASKKEAGAVPDSRSSGPEKQVSDAPNLGASETPGAASSAMLPELETPQTPSAPESVVEAEAAPVLQPEIKSEASEPAFTPAPETTPEETAPGGIPQLAPEEDVEKSPSITSTAEPITASKGTILQLTIAAENNMDSMFRQPQTDELDQLYWNPAVKLLNSIGAKNPLTQAFLYDMMVNHGQDGAQNLINKANYALGGTPGMGIDENIYLMKLMDLRETYLDNTGNPGADRVAAYRRILTEGNISLATPFDFTIYGDTFRIDGDNE